MTFATPTLIFVYNANGGLPSALGDMVHKIVSPRTYPCSLCALTYGAFSMRREWKDFLKRIGMGSLFLYRDEFRTDLDDRDLPLPAILLGGDSVVPQVLVSAAELDALPDLSSLTELVKARLAKVSN